MTRQFTAVYKKSGKWYLGWIEEIPGVNTQGRTLREVRENLHDAFSLILAENRRFAKRGQPKGKIFREPILMRT